MKNYIWILLSIVIGILLIMLLIQWTRLKKCNGTAADTVRVSGTDLSFYINQEDRLTTVGPAQRSIGTANYIITGQNIKVEYGGTGIIGQ